MLIDDVIGPYRVLSKLGEGGMGAVYRARDTKLDRDVAIKVLPEAFAHDAERLARFTREAKVLASLNHPHIAAIYGLETGPALPGLPAPPAFIVMELVEGEDLSQRIARGAIPLDEALPIAKQIAEALEAAHEQGIIHRDLKPANIKVRSDGTVKVLDFGLAKALDTGAGGAGTAGLAGRGELSNSPTITSPAQMTGVGVILGTAAYMAPEQAKGRTVDKRADIWAFGCVLFEMLTGTRAFPGEDLTDTLAAVVRAEPNWTLLPPDLPSALVVYIKRCLHKDPKQRIHDIADVRLALDGAFDITAPQTPGATSSSTQGARRAVMAALAVAAVAIVALAVPALSHLRETPPPDSPETRVDIVTPPTNTPGSFALSPDGRMIAYVATSDGASRLWVRPLDSISGQPLPGTENARSPFWSPDGRSLGFFADLKLERIDISGGSPQALWPTAGSTSSQGAWSAGGVILFSPGTPSGPLLRIPAKGGQAVAATTLGKEGTLHLSPRFLPDGKHFLFVSAAGTDPALWLGSLEDSGEGQGGPAESRRVTSLAPGVESAAEYLAPDWLIRVRGNTLTAQRFDAQGGQLAGDPIIVARDVGFDLDSRSGPFSVAASPGVSPGPVAWRQGTTSRRQLLLFNRSGQAAGSLGGPDEALIFPEFSPDGKRVAITRGALGSRDVWIQEGTGTSRLTFDAANDVYTLWSPDGARVVFASNRKGSQDLYVKQADGSGIEEPLLESADTKRPNSWSPNGQFILFSTELNNGDLMVVPVTGERKAFTFLSTPFTEQQGVFSPDGKWVAYQSNESGRHQIYVRPFPGPGGQWQISTGGGTSPRWRADGKELYYLAADNMLMAVAVSATGGTFLPRTPEALFQTHPVPLSNKPQYDVARDGRFLISTELQDASAEPIHLLLNWKPPSK